MGIQTQDELDDFYKKQDPWDYENTPDDKERKAILMAELEQLPVPRHTLDIGCGHGFITRDLPGKKVTGVDYSPAAIKQANKISKKSHTNYAAFDLFDLSPEALNEPKKFDCILITGVLYPQYIGNAHTVVYDIIDRLLAPGGYVVSVHIGAWYSSRFPYVMIKNLTYKYRDYQHYMEIYQKP